MSVNVGERLKAYRAKLGVSQRELARRSGQSPASISAIEMGRVSPSIETLKRLLDCLGPSLSEFFATGTTRDQTAFFAPDEMVEIEIGFIRYRQLDRSFDNLGMQLTCTRVMPGSDTGLVSHQSEDGEIGLVLQGEVEVSVDEEIRILGPREGYVVRGGQRIRIRNISEAIAEYVFFSSPAAFRTILRSVSKTNLDE